jgi:XTP/dITP diphosphohydrolase
MNNTRELVLGTHNLKKRRELELLLAPAGFQLKTLADFPEAIAVVEDGQTFAENARKKACQQAVHLRRWVLGEDSGLCVDALDGHPGVRSARFSGEQATDESNNQLLLERLANVPIERRTAHYVCHVTLSDPSGIVLVDCAARCHGRIALQPAGSGGFGYDPLFEIAEYHRTFGELGDAVKAVLSHRGRAIRQMVTHLLRLLQQGHWPLAQDPRV